MSTVLPKGYTLIKGGSSQKGSQRLSEAVCAKAAYCTLLGALTCSEYLLSALSLGIWDPWFGILGNYITPLFMDGIQT